MWFAFHPLLLIVSVIVLLSAQGATHSGDISILQDLYHSTNGVNWDYASIQGTDWLFEEGANPCGDEWKGIFCNASFSTCSSAASICFVTEIKLPGCRITGELPGSLGGMDRLHSVVFDNNMLTGRFPTSLYRLSNISYISMIKNLLGGPISTDIKFATTLKELHLDFNSLSGLLPESIGQVISLEQFTVTRATFNSSIPQSFGSLTKLKILKMGSCSLTGLIPASLGSLSRLSLLYLENNSLQGVIPEALFGFSALHFLSLSTNRLTGTIPSFESLINLKGISLSNNKLTGSIPTDIGFAAKLVIMDFTSNKIGHRTPLKSRGIPLQLYTLTSLRYLFLGDNRLEDTISENVGNLTGLRELDLSVNPIGGHIPESLYNLTLMSALYLDSCSLTGSVSPSIGNLINLKQFTFEDNRFSSSLPSTLAQMSSLVVFTGQKNDLTGKIENIFGQGNSNLELIDLSYNHLTGSVAPDFFLCPSLKTVAIMGNCFSGTISERICSSGSLELLLLDGLHAGESCHLHNHDPLNAFPTYRARNMEGTIPACLFGMANLTTLHLSGNGFYGGLDASLLYPGSQLRVLTVSHNRLTGTIPKGIQRWNSDELDLQYNRISGTLNEMQNVNQRMRLKLKYNRLTGYITDSVKTIRDPQILDGNRFQCRDRSELPDNDPLREEYSCGSSEFNLTIYIVGILGAFFGLAILILTLLIFLNRHYDNIWPAGRRFADWVSDSFVYFRRCVDKISRLQRVDYLRGSDFAMPSALSANTSTDNIPNLWLFVDTLIEMLRWKFRITCIIVFVFMPIYIALKQTSDFSTHTHHYWYVTCALFMKGQIPAATIFSVWFAMIIALTVFSYTRHSAIRDNPFYQKLRRVKKSFVGKMVLLSNRMVGLLIMMMFCNLIVVFLANGVYVFTTLSEVNASVKTLAEITLAGFQLLWNATVVPKSIEWLTRKWSASFDDKIWLNIIVLIFNSVCAPCLISAVTDIDCFQYAFVNSPVIQSRYSFIVCDVYDLQQPDDCILEREIKANTEFVSPFSYNYNCTSSLLYNFIPVFMYKFIYIAFIDPLVFARVCSIESRRVPNWLRGMLPGILWPMESDATTPSRIFKPSRILCQQLSYLAILLTFGVMCPPLAALILLACIVVCLKWQILLGRYLLCFEDTNDRNVSIVGRSIDWISVLDIRCNFIWRGPWMVHWAIVWTSAIFFTLYALDIASDEVGIPESLWVGSLPLAAALLSWFGWLGWRYMFPFISEIADAGRSISQTSDTIHHGTNVKNILIIEELFEERDSEKSTYINDDRERITDFEMINLHKAQ